MEEEEKDSDASKNEGGASWWSSWGSTWIETVKEKSAVTFEMVKKDLNEFVDVIQGDTSVAISDTATKIEQKTSEEKSDNEEDTTKKVVQKGMEGLSKFLHSVSELMAIEPDDTQEEFITLSEDRYSTENYNRKQEKLYVIQTNPGTYCNEPEGLFGDWLQIFSLDDHKTEMSELLVQNPSIRAIYTQLVPNVVSHTVFWQRYFYQVFLLDAEERRREQLLARANDADIKDETDGGWGDDEEDDIEVISKTESSIKPIQIVAPIVKTEVDVVASSDSVKDEIVETSSKNNVADEPSTLSMNRVTPGEVAIAVNIQQTHEDIEQSHPEKINNDIGLKKDHSLDEVTSKLQKTDFDRTVPNEGLNKSSEVLTESSDESKQFLLSHSLESEPADTKKKPLNTRLQLSQECDKLEQAETSSISSWISIDDDIKVKRIKGEQELKADTVEHSEGKSSNGSSEVLVNKSDADGLEDDDDFDLDLDNDVNEEELAKLVAEIKNKSANGDLQDDDDWENWE